MIQATALVGSELYIAGGGYVPAGIGELQIIDVDHNRSVMRDVAIKVLPVIPKSPPRF